MDPAVDPTKQPIDDEGFLQNLGIGLLIALVAVAVIYYVVRKLLDRRLAHPAKLADHELVTLTGIVRAVGATLTAPLSGRTCIAYRSHARLVGNTPESVAKFGLVGGKGLKAEPIAEEHVAFTLETANGAIVIGGDPLELVVTPERVIPAQPDRERAFLDRFGLAADYHDAGFDEIVLAPGAKIAIRGMLRIEADALAAGERGYRDEGPRRMRLIAPGDEPIKVLRIW